MAGGVHGFAAALTSFIGRDEPVREVAGLLGRHRLVTVTVPCGSATGLTWPATACGIARCCAPPPAGTPKPSRCGPPSTPTPGGRGQRCWFARGCAPAGGSDARGTAGARARPGPGSRRARRGDEPGHRGRVRPDAHRPRPATAGRSDGVRQGKLSARERELVTLVARGRTDAQIAAAPAGPPKLTSAQLHAVHGSVRTSRTTASPGQASPPRPTSRPGPSARCAGSRNCPASCGHSSPTRICATSPLRRQDKVILLAYLLTTALVS
jgi:hypothetical protein